MRISSATHPLVKHLVKIRKDRAYRREMGRAVILGQKLVCELAPQYPIQTLFVLEGKSVPPHLRPQKIYIVNQALLNKVADVKNAENILAEVIIPPERSFENKKRIVALDRITDPGNLGTLLRTALAFGFEGAYLLEGSVDPFNDKAIRAAKGASFKLPLATGTEENLLNLATNNNLTTYIADIEGTSLPELQPEEPFLLILGNESQGISKTLKPLGEKITIPMPGNIESLNVAVAGAIIMYHLMKL